MLLKENELLLIKSFIEKERGAQIREGCCFLFSLVELVRECLYCGQMKVFGIFLHLRDIPDTRRSSGLALSLAEDSPVFWPAAQLSVRPVKLCIPVLSGAVRGHGGSRPARRSPRIRLC